MTNILNFSTSKNNIKENSSKLIILPSILNSSIKDDSSKKIIPKRRIMKLKTEKIPENKMKLFQNEIKNAVVFSPKLLGEFFLKTNK